MDKITEVGKTDFQQSVFNAVRAIPAGTVKTYGMVAEEIGSVGAGRAVGQALIHLELDSDVPWWRTCLAGGYIAKAEEEQRVPEAVAATRARMAEEGVAFTNDGRVAALADGRAPSSGGGRSRTKYRVVDASPCYDPHTTVQFTCRYCNPSGYR